MTFKSFEHTYLELGVFSLLSSLGMSFAHAQTIAPTNPATVEACVALASNADRLACYDSLFKAPTVISPQVQAAEAIPLAAPIEIKNEIAFVPINLFICYLLFGRVIKTSFQVAQTRITLLLISKT